jgi:hypothetical protein
MDLLRFSFSAVPFWLFLLLSLFGLRAAPDSPYSGEPLDGVVAQLVERLNGIQEVRGSNPLGSTILRPESAWVLGEGWCPPSLRPWSEGGRKTLSGFRATDGGPYFPLISQSLAASLCHQPEELAGVGGQDGQIERSVARGGGVGDGGPRDRRHQVGRRVELVA